METLSYCQLMKRILRSQLREGKVGEVCSER